MVQLREGTALTPEGMQGRIEHIVSGQAALFTSLAEFGAFMAQVLAAPGGAALPQPAPAPEQGGPASPEGEDRAQGPWRDRRITWQGGDTAKTWAMFPDAECLMTEASYLGACPTPHAGCGMQNPTEQWRSLAWKQASQLLARRGKVPQHA